MSFEYYDRQVFRLFPEDVKIEKNQFLIQSFLKIFLIAPVGIEARRKIG